MVVISFINLKGGVGKTTCCANIAGELARENRKVLVIDADPQANLSILLMGTRRYNSMFPDKKDNKVYENTIYQIFLDAIEGNDATKKFDFNKAIIKSVVRQKVRDKTIQPLTTLDLLPATYHLMQLEQKIVNYVRSRYAILNGYIQQIKDKYEFILIDCPPNIYTTTHNSLYASDYYIIPTIPDYLSISGIPLLVQNLNKTIEIKKEDRNESVKLLGILINLMDARINVHKTGKRHIELLLESFKNDGIVNQDAIIFNSIIRNLVDVKNASGIFLPVCIDSPKSNSTMEFRKLCHEIVILTQN